MTNQVLDLFEWDDSKLPVCRGGCVLPKHPGIERCATWWTPESGRVRTDEQVADLQRRFDEQAAATNARRRAAGLPELPAPVASKYWENGSDCYREYIATWGVRDDRLVVVLVEGNYRLSDGNPVPVPHTGRFTLGVGKAQFAWVVAEFPQYVHLDFTEGRLQAVTRT